MLTHSRHAPRGLRPTGPLLVQIPSDPLEPWVFSHPDRMLEKLGEMLFPPPGSSTAATEYYLMNLQLVIFFGAMLMPSKAFDMLFADWMATYAMPILLVVMYLFFDTSVALYDMMDDGEVTQYDKVRQQRNLYLSVINIVLMVANVRFFWLMNANKRLRAALAQKKER